MADDVQSLHTLTVVNYRCDSLKSQIRAALRIRALEGERKDEQSDSAGGMRQHRAE